MAGCQSLKAMGAGGKTDGLDKYCSEVFVKMWGKEHRIIMANVAAPP
jgi:hypothetical protein